METKSTWVVVTMDIKLQEQLEMAILAKVDKMNIEELQQYVIDDLWEYLYTADDEEILDFINEE